MGRLQQLRNRLTKHREKIAELEAQAATMEREIISAEDEQLGYLARSVANNLSGGMEEIFEMLRSLRANPNKGAAASIAQNANDKEDDAIAENQ